MLPAQEFSKTSFSYLLPRARDESEGACAKPRETGWALALLPSRSGVKGQSTSDEFFDHTPAALTVEGKHTDKPKKAPEARTQRGLLEDARTKMVARREQLAMKLGSARSTKTPTSLINDLAQTHTAIAAIDEVIKEPIILD